VDNKFTKYVGTYANYSFLNIPKEGCVYLLFEGVKFCCRILLLTIWCRDEIVYFFMYVCRYMCYEFTCTTGIYVYIIYVYYPYHEPRWYNRYIIKGDRI